MLLCFFFSAVPLERVSFQGVEMWVSFFPVTLLEEHMSLLAQELGIIFPIAPPEEHVSLRGVGR